MARRRHQGADRSWHAMTVPLKTTSIDAPAKSDRACRERIYGDWTAAIRSGESDPVAEVKLEPRPDRREAGAQTSDFL
jgi:hypothetical protein